MDCALGTTSTSAPRPPGLAPELRRGRFRAWAATTPRDTDRALALRGATFRDGACDRDSFDARCTHVLVEDTETSGLMCTFRLLFLDSGAQIGTSYAAQVYGLDRLSRLPGPMIEMGRFCIARGCRDADVLRVAWGALTRCVDQTGARMLFGCSSFAGIAPAPHADALALLGARHLAPRAWRPTAAAAEVVALPGPDTAFDARSALRGMPPLLRTYLAMGGRVSDHAVIDRDLETLHVFTGVDIATIPPARARALREIAG